MTHEADPLNSPVEPVESGGREDGLILVGWREWITLPDTSSPPIKAKVDTGARSSALHATRIRTGGEGWIRFLLHPHQRRNDDPVEIRAPLVDHRKVRSSSGVSEPRPTVQLTLGLGPYRWPVEVTLTRRDRMGFRMLLGRTALRGRCLVDPGASFLLGQPPGHSTRSDVPPTETPS